MSIAAPSKNFRDLTDYRSGRLVVKTYLGQDREGKRMRSNWLCDCDCGKTATVSTRSLTKPIGATRSCGCLQREKASQLALAKAGKPRRNLTGMKIDRLTVVEFGGIITDWSTQRTTWICKCECGNSLRVRSASLTRSNPTRSCGCLQRERTGGRNWKSESVARPPSAKRIETKAVAPRRKKPPATRKVCQKMLEITPEFSNWLEREYSGMKRRCEDPTHRYYDLFGASGVRFAWANFEEFKLWIVAHLGLQPAGTKLVRPDRYGHFEPGNLRWCQTL